MKLVIETIRENRPAEGGMPSSSSFSELALNDRGFELSWNHTNDIRGDDGVWRSTEGVERFANAEEVAEAFGEEHPFTRAAREYADADLADLLGRQERARQREKAALAENRRVFASS